LNILKTLAMSPGQEPPLFGRNVFFGLLFALLLGLGRRRYVEISVLATILSTFVNTLFP
jgi:hypothetical protein